MFNLYIYISRALQKALTVITFKQRKCSFGLKLVLGGASLLKLQILGYVKN